MGSSKFLDPTLLCLPLGCNFIFTFLNSKMVVGGEMIKEMSSSCRRVPSSVEDRQGNRR